MTECAVVFDVDDTLYLERDYVASGFRAVSLLVRERFGVDGFAAIAWQLFIEGCRGEIFDRALAGLGVAVTSTQLTGLVSAYREHEPDICMLPDGREALRALRAMGTPIAVLTGRVRRPGGLHEFCAHGTDVDDVVKNLECLSLTH